MGLAFAGFGAQPALAHNSLVASITETVNGGLVMLVTVVLVASSFN